MFVSLTCALAVVILAAMVYAFRSTQDVFHPALIWGSMVLFLYVYMPVGLVAANTLHVYLSEEQAAFAQFVNLVGVSAFLAGIHLGQRAKARRKSASPEPGRLFIGAVTLGSIGLVTYAYTLAFVGGFLAAYSDAYGGGTADLGYVRDGVLLTLPATLMLFIVWPAIRSRLAGVLLCGAFMAPLATHAVLGARRGPAFMVLIAVIGGWYLVRGRRPRLAVVAAGGAAIGFLMLALVANRGNIYIGADWDFSNRPTDYLQASTGNEFLFGSAAIVTASERRQYTWGGRYMTVLLVRPIPRALWPTKYADAAEWFGTPSMELTAGIDADAFRAVVGWAGAPGSAPGIVADLWVEFAWGSAAALLVIGWLLGRSWRKAESQGGYWTVMYATLMSVSVYLVMQTAEAMVFRFLLMAIPSWFVWWQATATPKRAAEVNLGSGVAGRR